MNNVKLELEKKKAQLAELKRRKRERELEKLAKTESSTQTSTFSYKDNGLETTKNTNGFEIIRTFHNTKSQLNEFENLNANEILNKCGLNEILNEKYTDHKASINTASSSSSISISMSSSCQSFKSSVNAQALNGSINNSTFVNNLNESNSTEYEDIFNKKTDHFNLSCSLDLHKLNITPYETITYNKETQTYNSYDHEHETPIENANHKNQSLKTKPKKEKPLAYFDDIFVYDTLQWEDECEFNPDEMGQVYNITKELNVDSLNLIESHLNFKNVFFNGDDAISKSLEYFHGDENEDASNFHKDSQPLLDSNEKLNRFLKKNYRVVSHALNQNMKNIFFDYSVDVNESHKDLSNDVIIKSKKKFSYSTNSVITCLDWSYQYPELLLCAYDNLSFNYEEADTESMAAIWNAKTDKKIPQQTFTCSSLITSCCFAEFNSNLIVGGTYSGQIVMWDIRCNKPTPIQRSALSIGSHVNPVYCIRVIENKDSQNLISISNDGKLCSWSLENLNLPIETKELCPKITTNRSVYATCFDVQTKLIDEDLMNEKLTKSLNHDLSFIMPQFSEFKQLSIIGAEDGLVHSFSLFNNKNNTVESFMDHAGPVTAISCYNVFNRKDYSYETNQSLSQLFLSSSFDSCIKLWNATDESSPIKTFECNGDYVFDVCWSPIHPALFASVDGAGKLDLWELNQDTEIPSASIELDNGGRALNKLKWSRKGTEIAVGNDHGEITIFDVNENFAQPGTDETKNFLKTLDDLKQIKDQMDKADKYDNNLEFFR